MELKVDPKRRDYQFTALSTDILVRAKDDDKWVNADICTLDLVSLKTWLRSRGGENSWAETCVAMILEHNPSDITEAWNEKVLP
jgi:hypothetical protein